MMTVPGLGVGKKGAVRKGSGSSIGSTTHRVVDPETTEFLVGTGEAEEEGRRRLSSDSEGEDHGDDGGGDKSG